MKTKFWATLAFCLILLSTFAEKVQKITIISKTGQAVSSQLVLNNMRTRKGSDLEFSILDGDVKRLYATALFSYIDTKVKKVDGGLEVILNLTVKPVLRNIYFAGNKEIKTKKLQKQLTVVAGAPLNEITLSENKSKIVELYKDKGYYGAEIKTRLVTSEENNTVDIYFEIEENESIQVEKVRFFGNKVFSDGHLKGLMSTSPSFFRYIFDSGFYNKFIFEQDKKALKREYEKNGYLDFKITKVEERLENGYIELDIYISEGQPYKINELAVQGHELFKTEEIQEELNMLSGMIYKRYEADKDVERLSYKYNAKGYVDFYGRPDAKLDKEKKLVDLTYRIREGEKFHIRDIHFYGNDVTKEYVMRREMALHPTDLANKHLIDASKNRLLNLQYFETVEAIPVDTDEPGKKDLHVKVKEKQTGRLSFGIGFSSQDSVLGSFEIQQTNFDHTAGWPYTGGGQRLKISGSLGSEYSNFNISFIEPWFRHERLRFETSIYRTSRVQEEYDETHTGAYVGLTKPLTNSWSVKGGLRLEYVEVDNFDNDVSPELRAEETSDFITSLEFALTRDTRNNFRRPTQGGKFSVSTDLQTELLASENNLFQLSIGGSKYYSVFEESVVKLKLNYTVVQEISGDVPIYERLFSGGQNTIRGYEFRQVSPVDSFGDEFGGLSSLVGTVELDIPLGKMVNLAFFSDAGNVWEDTFDVQPFDSSVTIGTGLRLNLPIGPVRIDYGYPIIHEQENGGSGRLHFNFGYSF